MRSYRSYFISMSWFASNVHVVVIVVEFIAKLWVLKVRESETGLEKRKNKSGSYLVELDVGSDNEEFNFLGSGNLMISNMCISRTLLASDNLQSW